VPTVPPCQRPEHPRRRLVSRNTRDADVVAERHPPHGISTGPAKPPVRSEANRKVPRLQDTSACGPPQPRPPRTGERGAGRLPHHGSLHHC
jgi:hypothetical protein